MKDKNCRTSQDLNRDIFITTQLRELAEQRFNLDSLLNNLISIVHDY
jgi:hypothetical protein